MEFLSNSASVASDVIIAVFLSLLTVATIAWAIVGICKNIDAQNGYGRAAFIIVFVVGLALRIVFGLFVRGFRGDYALFTRMFDHLKTNGLNGYYTGKADSVLYPIVYFVYLIFGGLSNATGLSDYGLAMQFMIKLPLIAASLLTALGVYLIAAKYFNKGVAFYLCAFVCFCPIFFIGSSIWTTPLTFTVMFACFGCYFLARKNYSMTILFMTLAAFCSKEGIYLFPVASVFSCFHFVRSIIALKNAKSDDKISIMENRAVFAVPSAFVLSVTGVYLIGLFLMASYSYNPFVLIYEFNLKPLVGWETFTVNGLSVYTIFNQNGSMPSARFPAWLFACIFGAIIFAVVCIVYFTKRNRATMVMLAAYAMFTMQIYYPGSTAIGFESVLLLVLAAYALVKDKRLLTVLFATGLVYVVNGITCLSVAGYLNNVGEFGFGTEQIVLTGGMSAVPIVCSIVALLMHLYFTVVAVGVGMTGQKKLLQPAYGILNSLKEYFKIKKAD